MGDGIRMANCSPRKKKKNTMSIRTESDHAPGKEPHLSFLFYIISLLGTPKISNSTGASRAMA